MTALSKKLASTISATRQHTISSISGRVSRFDGIMIECSGFPATIGTLCEIQAQDGGTIIAEIIGFQNSNNLLCVHETGARIAVGARVTVKDDGHLMAIGDDVLGRVVDALGNCLDDKPEMELNDSWPMEGVKLNPLARKPVNTHLDVGVRVINSLLTVGQGQRLGIIAGSGVGRHLV